MGSLNLNSSIAQTSVNTNETLDLTSTADRELSKRAPLSSFLPKPKWSNDEEIDLGDSDDEANVLAPDDSKVAVDLSNPTKILESLEEAKKSDCPVAWDLSVKDESASGASSSAIETSPEVISPPLKKFKRRNENMYAPEED